MSRIPLRYVPWLARDVLFSQGLVLFIVALLTGLILGRLDPLPPATAGAGLVANMVSQLGWLFVLYSTAAIVSTDRIQGYYRSFFSRPVSPPAYYLIRWLLGALAVALLVPVLTLAMSLAIGSFPVSWHLIQQLELLYLLLGGLTFLVSTATRSDWLIALLIYLVSSILNGLEHGGVKLPAVWHFVAKVLPPFQLTNVQSSPTGAALAHMLLYGAGLFLVALAVLRWRPLGVGGRS
jgi:hypothetical protein